MALTVNTNVASLTAQRTLGGSQSMLSTSLERLSTGLRINSAKDDAAGLAISERFTAQINGLNQGVRNANDAISLAQTAEGALKEVTNNLQRVRELAVQSVNGTNSVSDRAALDNEVQQLLTEINRVGSQTKFNGTSLLDGNFSGVFQVGADNGQKITVTQGDAISAADLGITSYSTSYASSADVTSTALAAGDVILNGVSVGASTSTSAFAAAAQDGSAQAKAAAINAGTSEHGVTATAGTTTVVGAGGSLSNTNTQTGTFTINGVSTGEITAGGTDAATLTAVRTAINNITSATGVSAQDNAGGDGIDLLSTSGQNIYVTYATGTGTPTADAFGIDVADLSTVHTGALSYVSTSSQGIAFTGSSLGKIGSSVDQAAAVDPASTGNVLTSANAEAMLTQVDSALDSVSDTRAALGATQNRFSSVVANLQTASENLSASRSRIMDADFAAETAQMTKAQILQQSGIAMLAQANSVPQNVLALLQ